MTTSTRIASVRAWEILDSRGNPTVRAAVLLEDGSLGVASVPSGASTGVHEALELRDGESHRYGGKGVLQAVAHVNDDIANAIVGMDGTKLAAVDRAMLRLDGTENKSRLGANAILSVSLATARAAAHARGEQLYQFLRHAYGLKLRGWKLPVPMMNIVNGGRHADSGMTIQEFMIIPHHEAFPERLRIGAEVFHALHTVLQKRKLATTVGDEGGFAPLLGENNEQAVKLILQAIVAAGYEPGKDVALGLDIAASEFYEETRQGMQYFFKGPFGKGKVGWTSVQMVQLVSRWMQKYPLETVEDPLDQDDWEGWKELTAQLGKHIRIVGDDLFVTNPKRLQKGIRSKVANAILIKVNQIGTLTETMRAIAMARRAKYGVVISHRSGETADTFIADLAVAVNAEYIKTGSLSRSERVEKYNRLLEIEQDIRA